MRGNTKYLIAIVAASILMAIMNTAFAMNEDISDLKKHTSVNENIRMNTARSTDYTMAISRDYAIQHSKADFS